MIARAYESLETVRRNDTLLNERNTQIRFNDGEQYILGFIDYINGPPSTNQRQQTTYVRPSSC